MVWSKICLVFSLVLALVGVTESVSASPMTAPKSFAVFVAFYNTHNDIVRGGVCGTVFFVSQTQAITAHHVLRAESFQPAPGFEKVRVWLVHEDYPAIEMKPEYVASIPDKDITQISLPATKKVDSRFVFAIAPTGTPIKSVETDGFVANTAGPTLARVGKDVDIVSVPHLERMHLSGSLVRQATVTLKALDIDLKASPNLELSYKPVVGISGGPVTSNGQVIGMNSFADPGTRQHTWALQIRTN
jgi:hypothetical protein